MHHQYVGKNDTRNNCIEAILKNNPPKSRFDILSIEIKNHLTTTTSPLNLKNVDEKLLTTSVVSTNSINQIISSPSPYNNLNNNPEYYNNKKFYRNTKSSYNTADSSSSTFGTNSNKINNNNKQLTKSTSLEIKDSSSSRSNSVVQRSRDDTQQPPSSSFRTLLQVTGEILDSSLLHYPITHFTSAFLNNLNPLKKQLNNNNNNNDNVPLSSSSPQHENNHIINSNKKQNFDDSFLWEWGSYGFLFDWNTNNQEEEEEEKVEEKKIIDDNYVKRTETSYINFDYFFNQVIQFFFENEQPKYEFSYHRGLLTLSKESRDMLNISTHEIVIYTNDTCIGNQFHQSILKILGYDVMVINNLLQSFLGRGFLKSSSSSTTISGNDTNNNNNNGLFLTLSNYSSYKREFSQDYILDLVQRLIETNLIFFSTIIIFGVSLKVCEFCLAKCFDRNPRQVLASPEYLIFLICTLITSYFSTWGLRSKESIRYYPIMFLSVLYGLVFYIVVFPSGYHAIAFYTCYSIIEYLLILCLFNFEIPAVLQNRIQYYRYQSQSQYQNNFNHTTSNYNNNDIFTSTNGNTSGEN
eukprot:gene1287-1626_t